jgi:hypothetical protein
LGMASKFISNWFSDFGVTKVFSPSSHDVLLTAQWIPEVLKIFRNMFPKTIIEKKKKKKKEYNSIFL